MVSGNRVEKPLLSSVQYDSFIRLVHKSSVLHPALVDKPLFNPDKVTMNKVDNS
jgi:hypothetical protein